MSDSWIGMTAADLGRAIAAGRVDPVALAEAFLDAARTAPAGVYARLTPERALAEARAAAGRAAQGTRRGPLDGVPLSWKDLFDSAGTATEAGSRLLRGRVPQADAAVLATATAGGAVCLGKTHMSELAFAGIGYNPMAGTPPNRHGADLVPGGSSSGAAASVAFGAAAAAVGSDTGGSVRIPAAWNDLVGLKTTERLLPLQGVVPLCESFDTVGPLTRSVEDAALMLGLLSGTAPAELSGGSLDGCRFAVLETVALEDVDPVAMAAFDSAIARLDRAGAQLQALAAPEVAEALPLSGVLYTTEAYGIWGETIEAAPDLMFDRVRERFLSGKAYSGAEFVRAWRRLRALRQDWAARSAAFDAVLLPTSANLPPRLDRVRDDADHYVAQNLLTLRNTRIGNLMGLCALTLPTGTPSCGLMLMAPPLHEARLLRLGAAAEAALANG